jgi:hypothetical protein
MVLNRAEGFATSPGYSSTIFRAGEVLRWLLGRSQTVLVRASHGFLYVVKMMAGRQWPNVLANGVMCNRLARYLGLSAPSWRPIKFSKGCLERKPPALAPVQEDRLLAKTNPH